MRAAMHPPLVLQQTQGGPALAFGLTWFAVLGSHAALQGRARARALRATHYVVGGRHAVAAGCARLPRRYGAMAVHSAAQAYANLHPEGAQAGVASLPDGQGWLIAVQDGSVLASADRLFADAAQAQARLRALLAQRPDLREAPAQDALDTLLARPDPAARLAPLAARWSRVPVAARAGVLALAVAGGVSLWRGAHQAPPPAAPDPRAVWRAAQAEFLRGWPVHTSSELARVLDTLQALPLRVAGWALRQAQCVPGPAWQCDADYHRVDVAATSLAFAAAVPPGWQMRLHTLEHTRVAWTLAGDRQGLDRITPASPADTLALAATLQRASAAFTHVSVGASQALAGPVWDGPPEIEPPPAPALHRRELVLDGPLRSLALVWPLPAPIGWTAVSLRVVPDAIATLRASVLSLHLQGSLYEQTTSRS